MVCPLCGERKARRTCPALNAQICAVCCGTKRLTQIRCPADCAYLASARSHPAAAVVRQQQRDVQWFFGSARDLSEAQRRLFLLVCAFLVRYEPDELQGVIDADVSEAVAALAATFETAARGLIYDHRPPSLPAERLLSALKPVLIEWIGAGGSSSERSAAVVLRRVEETVISGREQDPENRRAFLNLLERVMKPERNTLDPADAAAAEPSRLILP